MNALEPLQDRLDSLALPTKEQPEPFFHLAPNSIIRGLDAGRANRHLASAPSAPPNIPDIEIVTSSKAKAGSGRLDIADEGGLYYCRTHSMGIKNRKKVLALALYLQI
ncbi:hypothetical protein BKA70DRAFT_1427655 [Coprinopsis sp. MPI-PUGE-AT-0042]|nr:hypothetical protein BKA70DRAFT_1427655 [Coprinopsis sp. MPI-PUGE-AT-0042]